MAAPPTDPAAEVARLAKQARTMAILCAFLGPVIVATATLTYGLVRVLDRLRAQAGSENAIPKWFEPLLAFSTDSAPIQVGLGLLFTAVGIYAWRRPARGLPALRISAWIGAVAMLALAGLWWWGGQTSGSGAAYVGAGIGGHLVQAVMVMGAARFLGRADVRAAVAATY